MTTRKKNCWTQEMQLERLRKDTAHLLLGHICQKADLVCFFPQNIVLWFLIFKLWWITKGLPKMFPSTEIKWMNSICISLFCSNKLLIFHMVVKWRSPLPSSMIMPLIVGTYVFLCEFKVRVWIILPMLISSSVRDSPMMSNWNKPRVWENFWTATE